MRLIDADALVESIKGWYCKDCDNYNYVRCRACGTDDAINAIENAPTVDGWVSVKDRLPEEQKEVLVAVDVGDGLWRMLAWMKNGKWESSDASWDSADGWNVTHWHLLPSLSEVPKDDN